jgi:hypothetical protein
VNPSLLNQNYTTNKPIGITCNSGSKSKKIYIGIDKETTFMEIPKKLANTTPQGGRSGNCSTDRRMANEKYMNKDALIANFKQQLS